MEIKVNIIAGIKNVKTKIVVSQKFGMSFPKKKAIPSGTFTASEPKLIPKNAKDPIKQKQGFDIGICY